jgi:serine/threonine protein kinase
LSSSPRAPGGADRALRVRELEFEEQLGRLRTSAICALTQVLGLRDPAAGVSGTTSAELAARVAESLALDEPTAQDIEVAALLHDLGMMAVPESIVRKPGKLTLEERAVVGRHTEHGWSILRSIPGLDRAALIVLHHHEHYDGTGYPGRLCGEDIPIGARVLSVVDAFEAMVSDRPYRRALGTEEAIQRLIMASGSQFDPDVVRSLARIVQGRSARPSHRQDAPASEAKERQHPDPAAGAEDFAARYADELIDGKYRLVKRLGDGGMGEVFMATHVYLNTPRVIKVVRPSHKSDQEAHARFLREAQLAIRVDHPNVARLYELGKLADGSMYMVWEYIDGVNLASRMNRAGRFTPAAAVELTVQALKGLEAIHRAGIVHRDISPDNLMIAPSMSGGERVVVIDLGIAKGEARPEETPVTAADMFIGKPAYASPEHFGILPRGGTLDARADLYSLGVVLYELLAGVPLNDSSFQDMMIRHLTNDSERKAILPPGIPGAEDLQPVISRALRRDRNERFTSASEFADALRAALRGGAEQGSATPAYPATPRPAADPHASWRRTERIP